MSLARVLGVIDLLDGRAVHAVAGRRNEYQPHRQTARCSPDPLILADHYCQLGVGGLYVADLDAIAGGPLQIGPLKALAQCGLPLWIDAGVRSSLDWRQKRERLPNSPGSPAGRLHWVLATETLDGRPIPGEQPWPFDGGEDVTLGVDLRAGRVCGPAEKLSERPALELIGEWFQRGIRSFLPLEITSVGTATGPATESLCRQIREKFPTVELLSGGGVRHPADLQRLLLAGCDRVLVATALINGAIPPLFGLPTTASEPSGPGQKPPIKS